MVGTLRILLTHIAVYGPKLRAEVAKRAHAEKAPARRVRPLARAVHRAAIAGITVFNPGSIGPRRFSLPIVFGTIDITPAGVRLAHINCETGAAWSPP